VIVRRSLSVKERRVMVVCMPDMLAVVVWDGAGNGLGDTSARMSFEDDILFYRRTDSGLTLHVEEDVENGVVGRLMMSKVTNQSELIHPAKYI
jgi:hypothetical protein